MAVQTVTVAGDLTIDWNFAFKSDRNHRIRWTPLLAANVHCEYGGAALLGRMISEIANQYLDLGTYINKVNIVSPVGTSGALDLNREAKLDAGKSAFHHSYATWRQFPGKDSDKDSEEEPWRVEEFLGMTRHKHQPKGTFLSPPGRGIIETAFETSDNLLVLDNDGLGFAQEDWNNLNPPRANDGYPWVLLKMSDTPKTNRTDGDKLWEKLQSLYHESASPNRLIVVMPMQKLRHVDGVQISYGLCWDYILRDLLKALQNNAINPLTKCAALVVTIDAVGTLLVEDYGTKYTLVFGPKKVEGAEDMPYQGEVMGYTTCMTAFIAREILRCSDCPKFELGIRSGLIAMNKLYQFGYYDEKVNGLTSLSFPGTDVIKEVIAEENNEWKRLAEENKGEEELFGERFRSIRFQEGQIPKILSQNPEWTILYSQVVEEDPGQNLLARFKDIVEKGPNAEVLQNVPLGQFGKLVIIDHQEIAGFNYVRRQIGKYCYNQQRQRPLSIAIFGQPGSGKSFVIKQVVESLPDPKLRERIKDPLNYNISQFTSPNDLMEVLHKVQSENIEERIPLVCWDEFDTTWNSEELGWLHYFLAPMQDGRFWSEHSAHSIGNAIFVFTGSTCTTMDEFRQRAEQSRKTKAPDFTSRLQGYINVRGPNLQPKEDPSRYSYILRRAILLHSLLKKHAPRLFEKELHIDDGVLRAFLLVPRYYFSTRSMETLVTMSNLSDQNAFERSSLPPFELLQLHVETAEQFMRLVRSPEPSKEIDEFAEKMEKCYHGAKRSPELSKEIVEGKLEALLAYVRGDLADC